MSQSLDELQFTRSACHAAQLGQIDRLQRILATNPGAVHSDGGAGTSGYTPLVYAARAGQLEAVKMLLSHGMRSGLGAAAMQEGVLHVGARQPRRGRGGVGGGRRRQARRMGVDAASAAVPR